MLAAPTRLAGHADGIVALAALDGDRLVVGLEDGTVRVRELATGATLAEWRAEAAVGRRLAVLGDGRVAAGDINGAILVLDPATGTTLRALGRHDHAVRALVQLPDGRLVSASDDDTIRLWDAGGGSELGRLYAGPGSGEDPYPESSYGYSGGYPRGGVVALAVLGDGRLAAGHYGGEISIWDPASAALRDRFDSGSAFIGALAALQEGRLASGGSDGFIRVWDGHGRETQRLAGHTGWVHSLAALPGGRLASGSFDGTVRLWDLASAAQIGCFAGLGERVGAVAAIGDGRLVWAMEPGHELWMWTPASPAT